MIIYSHSKERETPERKEIKKMKTVKTIQSLCESGVDFTEEMMLEEVHQRLVNNEMLLKFYEHGMSIATTEEERKCVVTMILDYDAEIREIFFTYLYYKLRVPETTESEDTVHQFSPY